MPWNFYGWFAFAALFITVYFLWVWKQTKATKDSQDFNDKAQSPRP